MVKGVFEIIVNIREGHQGGFVLNFCNIGRAESGYKGGSCDAALCIHTFVHQFRKKFTACFNIQNVVVAMLA